MLLIGVIIVQCIGPNVVQRVRLTAGNVVFAIAASASRFGPFLIYCSAVRVAVVESELCSGRQSFPDVQIEKDVSDNLYIVVDVVFIQIEQPDRITEIVETCSTCPVAVYVAHRHSGWINHRPTGFVLSMILQIGQRKVLAYLQPIIQQVVFSVHPDGILSEERVDLRALVIKIT